MQSQSHSDLERMKEMLKRSKAKKDAKKKKNDPGTVRETDIMLVLHEEEVDLIEDLLCDLLESDAKNRVKKIALNILNHIQSDDDVDVDLGEKN